MRVSGPMKGKVNSARVKDDDTPAAKAGRACSTPPPLDHTPIQLRGGARLRSGRETTDGPPSSGVHVLCMSQTRAFYLPIAVALPAVASYAQAGLFKLIDLSGF
jgi:hypothetical protein